MAELLAEANKFQEDSKPYFGFSKLKIGFYKIEKFRLVTNQYFDCRRPDSGPEKTLLVELKDQVLFMPGRISELFKGKQEKIDELNNSDHQLFLFYGGTFNK